MLDDGDYDALVVDAEDLDDTGAVRVELTVTSGPHKGDVVALRGRFPGKVAVALLAEPATLRVREGRPSVTLG